jgi:hypothetical protein
MRNPDNCNIDYAGFKSPRSFEEVKFEILGLKNLIKKAEERISSLDQSAFLAEIAMRADNETLRGHLYEQEE